MALKISKNGNEYALDKRSFDEGNNTIMQHIMKPYP